jgi:hypothetical protein
MNEFQILVPIIAILVTGTAVIIPIAGITARFALKPVVGPEAGARGEVGEGETVFLITAQRSFGWVGLAAAGGAPSEPLRGVFIPRDSARIRPPREVAAWFGMDAAALAARGVRVGQGVTAFKRAMPLAGSRFAARSLDDRAGSTALLMALRQIDPRSLPHRVLFVWSTREESGLVGARELAARLGPTVRRVYTVDTFVSSDTPLESPHFAFAPLGEGPVLRGLDDASITPDAERERVLRLARERGIPLQQGTTHGGTDGSAFTFYGAPNVGLSWPGRYSHSPGEVLDLRDLDALARLIAAVVQLPD